MPQSVPRSFPGSGDLHLGVASAAYQIEGFAPLDGRGQSIWDTFAATPGAVLDGSDGSVGCRSYPDPTSDLELVSGLGVDWYRFSVAWPRVMPDGTGAVVQRGLDYYDRLVDGLLDRGVGPAPTLYHWDLPQTLEDRGGWLCRETAEAFAEYAGVVHDRLGDRVEMWATLNEPWCSAYLGYASGRHAPGRQVGGDAHRAAHHLLLAHALGAARLRDAGASHVGLVLNLTPVIPEDPAAETAAEGVDAIRNRIWLGPLVDGEYDKGTRYVAPVLEDPELVQPGDLALIRGSASWLGVNYYTPARVGAGATAAGDGGGDAEVAAFPGVDDFHLVPRHPRTDIDWEIDAGSLETLLVETHERTGLPLLVTENGAAYDDLDVLADGTVEDVERIDYLWSHHDAVVDARARGADVRAWMVWTLMDNFEWSHGYTQNFGLVSVDRSTLRRTPKRSYAWYADLIRRTHGD